MATPKFINSPVKTYGGEIEVVRVSGEIFCRKEDAQVDILRWAQARLPYKLSDDFWSFKTSDHIYAGKNCSTVRITEGNTDIWAFRSEDPDQNVAGQIWSTEVVVASQGESNPVIGLRLLTNSPKREIDFVPSCPGLVRQIIDNYEFYPDEYASSAIPSQIKSDSGLGRLFDYLESPERRVPVVIGAVGYDNEDLIGRILSMIGGRLPSLAVLIQLRPEQSFALSDYFGKKLSVFDGGIRIYMPGFNGEVEQFGRHELYTKRFIQSESDNIFRRLCWAIAKESVRQNRIGSHVITFLDVKNATLQARRAELSTTDTDISEKLALAEQSIDSLIKQLGDARALEEYALAQNTEIEQELSEFKSENRILNIRIGHLTQQIKNAGHTPDEAMALPAEWDKFADWCDEELEGRVHLSQQARKRIKGAFFKDVAGVAKCFQWLSNEGRDWKLNGGQGTFDQHRILPSYWIANCGGDTYDFTWNGKSVKVDWHIKNGTKSRAPESCLRVYFFWDASTKQFIISDMPAHRTTAFS